MKEIEEDVKTIVLGFISLAAVGYIVAVLMLAIADPEIFTGVFCG